MKIRVLDDQKRNCLSEWFPLLQQVDRINLPETRILRLPEKAEGLFYFASGHRDAKPARHHAVTTFINDLKMAAIDIGYPVFMRTGLTSMKHGWRGTCYVDAPHKLVRHLKRFVGIVFDSIEPMRRLLSTDVWAIREYLEPMPGFTAFNGTPIGKERRYFINDGEVICHHPYWPAEAIHQFHFMGAGISLGLPDDWEQQLEVLNYESLAEVTYLTMQAERIAAHFTGCWSVDFMQSNDGGKWYVIDMATGDRSYHWPGCRHNCQIRYDLEMIDGERWLVPLKDRDYQQGG
jgi:hypothetical protein